MATSCNSVEQSLGSALFLRVAAIVEKMVPFFRFQESEAQYSTMDAGVNFGLRF